MQLLTLLPFRYYFFFIFKITFISLKLFRYTTQKYVYKKFIMNSKNNNNYLITESEVVTEKSQTEALPY